MMFWKIAVFPFHVNDTIWVRVAKMFQMSESLLKILGVKRVN